MCAKKRAICAVSLLMTAAIGIPFFPGITSSKNVRAEFEKTLENTGLCVTKIVAPQAADSVSDPWRGNYVWYGSYSGKSVKYRVLNPQETKYGGKTLFLDCDQVLYNFRFENDPLIESCDWSKSLLKYHMNEDWLDIMFESEYAAVTSSKVASHEIKYKDDEERKYPIYQGLDGEKFFVLDAQDLVDPTYGFRPDDGEYHDWNPGKSAIKSKFETNEPVEWRLRNPELVDVCSGSVETDGSLGEEDIYNSIGVAPAFNLDQKAILFSSIVSGTYGKAGTISKLTIVEDKDNLDIYVPSGRTVEKRGDKVIVPYSISGLRKDEVEQISVLILNKKFTKGNTNNASILYYDALDTGSISDAGEGTFPYPTEGQWGKDYFVYVFAEIIEEAEKTDFASSLLEIKNPEEKQLDPISGITIKSDNYGKNLKVSWDELDSAQDYEVYQQIVDKDGKTIEGWNLIKITSESSYSRSSLSESQEYQYKIRGRAKDSYGYYYSPYSEIAKYAPRKDIVVDVSKGEVLVDSQEADALVYLIVNNYVKTSPVSDSSSKYSLYLDLNSDGKNDLLLPKAAEDPVLVYKDWSVYGSFSIDSSLLKSSFYSSIQFILPEKLDEVEIVFDAPIVGAKPDYEPKFPDGASYYNELSETEYMKNNIEWFDLTKDEPLKVKSGKFINDHRYRVSIRLSAKDGYKFPAEKEDIKAKVNGKNATSVWVYGDEIEVNYEFEKIHVTPTPTKKPTAPATPTPTKAPEVTATPTPTKSPGVTVTPSPTPTKAPEKDPDFEDFVERLYVVALNRASEPEGKEFWVKQVVEEGKSGADCARFFLLDAPEFMERKLSVEEFVETLYGTFFDRESDPDGKAGWVDAIKSGKKTRAEVVNDFIESTEWCDVCATYGVKSGAIWHKATKPSKNALNFATRLYTCCLNRQPEDDGLKYWALALTNLEQTGCSAAKEFFTSDEFVGFKTSDEEYVKRLYTTFMDREPAESEVSFWIGEIKKGTQTRSSVIAFFGQSPEFTDICKKYGIDRGTI